MISKKKKRERDSKENCEKPKTCTDHRSVAINEFVRTTAENKTAKESVECILRRISF